MLRCIIWNEEIREKLARLAHEQWTCWMDHLFSKSVENADGTFCIPAESVARWKQQMATPYSALSEKEKDSDRAEADRVIDVLSENVV